MTTTASFCRSCGKALSEVEKATPGLIYCAACAPAAPPLPAQPPASGPPTALAQPPGPGGAGVSPGLAFLLGLLPGVGAIYNGQYVKGLVHVFVFGLLISIANMPNLGELEPLTIMMTLAWFVYMPFEAYHTAKRRQEGHAVDEFSSLVPLRSGSLAGPAALIVIGALFLLHNLGLLRLSQVLRYWPVLLIGLGVYMLVSRLTGGRNSSLSPAEVSHERL